MTTKATSRFLFDLDQLPAKAPAEECLWMEIERLEAERDRILDELELWDCDNEDELRCRLEEVEYEMRYLEVS